MKKRLQFVDLFRSFAILFMLGLNVFDFFSKINVHVDAPFYIKSINSVTIISPMIIFSFVSGMSVYLMLKSRFKRQLPYLEIMKEVIKKYGIYILISIPFTWFMFGIDIFFKFGEAVQGICASAIFLALLMLIKKIRENELIAAFVIQSILILVLSFSRAKISLFSDLSILQLIFSFIKNLFFLGDYSVFSTLPIFFGGVFFLRNLIDKKIKKLTIYAFIFSVLAMVLHFTIDPINYYVKSFSFLPYALAILYWLCLFLYVISEKIKTGFFRFVGMHTIHYYFLHYLLILKPLQLLNKVYSFPNLVAVFAVLFTYVVLFLHYNLKGK